MEGAIARSTSSPAVAATLFSAFPINWRLCQLPCTPGASRGLNGRGPDLTRGVCNLQVIARGDNGRSVALRLGETLDHDREGIGRSLPLGSWEMPAKASACAPAGSATLPGFTVE